jgi:CRP-like cAMP-binding protein
MEHQMDWQPEQLIGNTRMKLLAGFSEKDRNDFLHIGRVYQYHLHDTIIREQDEDLNLYLVLEGAVSLWRRNIPVTNLQQGDVFNESKIFLPRSNANTVVADDETVILKCSRQDVLQFFTRKPERLLKIFVLNIVAILSNKLTSCEDILIQRQLDSMPAQEDE